MGTTTGSVEEAMKAMAEFGPTVVLSDLGQPEEDGDELISRIRNLPAGRRGTVPAIALTAFARLSTRKRH